MRHRNWITLLTGLFALLPAPALARQTWTRVLMVEGQKNYVMAMHAPDSSNAFLVAGVDNGGNSEMQGHKTTNGNSFSRTSLPTASGAMAMIMFSAVAMLDANVLFLGGMEVSFPNFQNKLWRSTNGGGSWEVVSSALPELPERLVVLSDGTLVGAHAGGIFRVTGTTVTDAAVPALGDRSIAALQMLDDLVGYAAGGNGPTDDEPNVPYGDGFVLKTTDGGQTWSMIAQNLPMKVHSVFFLNEERGWIGGAGPTTGLLYRSTDDGATWSPLTLPPHPEFDYEITMPWKINQHVDPTPPTDVVGVRFFDCNRGVALAIACIGGCDSDQPTFITLFWHTSDAGNTWEFDPDFEPVMVGGQMMPEAKKLSAMLHLQFPGINSGFIAGQHAMVLRYSALVPEAEPGPPPATCVGGNNNNNNNNTNNGTGDDPSGSDDGCGCRTGSRGPFAPAGLPLLGLGLLLARRRKRHG